MVRVFNAPIGSKMFLKLVQDGVNASLILVDDDGDKVDAGNILTISEEGISFHSSITRDAPFKMTSDREIYKIG